MREFGIAYRQVDLKNGRIDLERVAEKMDYSVKLILMQRSTGYDWRPALSIEDIKKQWLT